MIVQPGPVSVKGRAHVSARLTLVSHSSTSATAAAAFPAGEPLDQRGRSWALAARGLLPRAQRIGSGPAPACRQTCEALGLVVEVDPMLADWDLGRWRGRTLDEMAAGEPDAVQAWLADPTAAPHGGEPLVGLLARVEAWLTAVPVGHTIAVIGPALVRAAVVVTLGAPPGSFWQIDVPPLTTTDLRGGPPRWTIRATGVALAGPRRPAEGVDGDEAH